MRIKVLGAGGGIDSGGGTSAILVNRDTLIDAGSGLESLGQEDARHIRHVFLTHAHMDHISGLPLLVETVFDQNGAPPLRVHGLPGVIQVLQDHIFNGQVWPDFSRIPDPSCPALIWEPLSPTGQWVGQDFAVTAFATHHDVPSCGFFLQPNNHKSFVVTGDTGYTLDLVHALNRLGPIDVLLTECSLPNRLGSNADRFFHLTPDLVGKIVAELEPRPGEVWLNHLKPSVKKEILAELSFTPLRIVRAGQIWDL